MIWKRLLIVLGAIMAIELVWLFFDSTPSYFFGDSESYLATAVINYIPGGRSFLYGLLIRRVALHTHSLEALIYLQCFLTGIAAWLIAVTLARVFSATISIAASFGLLCAVEPLQLLMERYVMTEAVSNFLFAVYFFLILLYVRRGRLWLLLLAQPIGVALIAIRISFLPQVLVNSVLAPLISPAALVFYRTALDRARRRVSELDTAAFKTAVLHLVLCLAVSQCVIGVYKHWYGALMHRPPALLYESGAFLTADLAPLIELQDFPDRARGQAILRRVHVDLKNPGNRPSQHFSPGGLWDAIRAEYPNETEANDIAVRVATHALFRRPAAAVQLAFHTYESYFDRRGLAQGLLVDEGTPGDFGPSTVKWLKQDFGVPDVRTFELTATKRWHEMAIPWYWTILVLLTVSPALLFVGSRETLGMRILVVVTALIFLEGVTLTVDRATVRFLTTPAWLVLLMLGMATQSLLLRTQRNSYSRHSVLQRS